MGLVLLHQNLVYISTYPSCYQPCHWCVKWIVPSWWVTSLLNMTRRQGRATPCTPPRPPSMQCLSYCRACGAVKALFIKVHHVLVGQLVPQLGAANSNITFTDQNSDEALLCFFNLQSTLGKYSIKACDRWILPSIYFPLHYIHMNSTTNLFCTESHLFLLWREQIEGIWYHHSPDFSVTGQGPFKLPLILLM